MDQHPQGVHYTVEPRKLEHERPPVQTQRKKESSINDPTSLFKLVGVYCRCDFIPVDPNILCYSFAQSQGAFPRFEIRNVFASESTSRVLLALLAPASQVQELGL